MSAVAADVVLVFSDVGEMREIAEGAHDRQGLVGVKAVERRLKLPPRADLVVAVEADRGLTDPLDQLDRPPRPPVRARCRRGCGRAGECRRAAADPSRSRPRRDAARCELGGTAIDGAPLAKVSPDAALREASVQGRKIGSYGGNLRVCRGRFLRAQSVGEPGAERSLVPEFAFVDDERAPAHGGISGRGSPRRARGCGRSWPANRRRWSWACARRGRNHGRARSSRGRRSRACAGVDHVGLPRQIGAIEPVAGRGRTQQRADGAFGSRAARFDRAHDRGAIVGHAVFARGARSRSGSSPIRGSSRRSLRKRNDRSCNAVADQMKGVGRSSGQHDRSSQDP